MGQEQMDLALSTARTRELPACIHGIQVEPISPWQTAPPGSSARMSRPIYSPRSSHGLAAKLLVTSERSVTPLSHWFFLAGSARMLPRVTIGSLKVFSMLRVSILNSYHPLMLAVVVFFVTGCGPTGPQGGPRVGTVQVTGTVMVDGAPAGFLKVSAVPKGGAGAVPMNSTALTAGNGVFSLSTYESGDGVPPGDYTLTFVWGEMNLLNGQYSGDKLEGRYADAEKSEVPLTITAGADPKDLGTIELSTQ